MGQLWKAIDELTRLWWAAQYKMLLEENEKKVQQQISGIKKPSD